jgi:hypothetical protein
MAASLASLAIVAAAMMSAPASAPTPVPGPIHLVVETLDDTVRLKVVGESDVALSAAYSLEVSGGGNRSLQRGQATLRPGVSATLVTLTLGSGKDWAATLRVSPDGGQPYQRTAISQNY